MYEIEDFIDAHRDELKAMINKSLNFVPRTASCRCPKNGTDHYHDDVHDIDDEELRQWILNDEGLYNWARSEGIEI